MRDYAAAVTAILAELISMIGLWELTKIPIEGCIFLAFFAALAAAYAFACITEPKKARKAKWMETKGGLKVMVMEGRRYDKAG